ncbi:MAG: DUF1015 domain-containing protein [Dehalococcoidia bacterium]|nr:DUF1015 domain-containing protein [Dehalococcoidia bacterium]
MAQFRPFHGIRFNPNKISDLADVICPPYDIISPAEQEAYYRRSDYNMIRLEFGRNQSGDAPGNNKYTRTGETFRQWIQDGILHRDESPSFYIHKQLFQFRGTEVERLGLTGCLKLEPWEKRIVLPHENTRERPKQDRLQLLRACRANISPIFVLYEDENNTVGAILSDIQKGPPLLNLSLETGEKHWIWKIEKPEQTAIIEKAFISSSLSIADGHHRYETAITFHSEVKGSDIEESAGYVMITLVDFKDKGLLILPVHRLVKGLSAGQLGSLKNRFENLFILETVPLHNSDSQGKPFPEELNHWHDSAKSIGVLGVKHGELLKLTYRPEKDYNALMPAGHSPYYNNLDVSRLQHMILDDLFSDGKEADVMYTHDEMEVFQKTSSGEYQLGFLLPPLKAGDIKHTALSGDKMPEKSTYFYPKLPTGLVMRRLEPGTL